MELKANNRVAKKPGNLEFDNLGKKTWNLRNLINNLEKLEFCTKVLKKPENPYKNHGKTWNVLTILI